MHITYIELTVQNIILKITACFKWIRKWCNIKPHLKHILQTKHISNYHVLPTSIPSTTNIGNLRHPAPVWLSLSLWIDIVYICIQWVVIPCQWNQLFSLLPMTGGNKHNSRKPNYYQLRSLFVKIPSIFGPIRDLWRKNWLSCQTNLCNTTRNWVVKW